MKLSLIALFAAVLLASPAEAQTPSPSADDQASPVASPATPHKAKKVSKSDDTDAEEPKSQDKQETQGKKDDDKGAASVIGKTLKLNGASGSMEIAKGDSKDKPIKLMSLKLSGEVISNPQQKCEISIVGDGPMPMAHEGSPDGLPRYAAEIPACPLSFDVVEGGVIVPPQTQACVFQAADCQASPSGVWGPDATALADQAKTLAKDRSRAETSISESLKTLGKRSKGEDDELSREQSDFNALRDETCRGYQSEPTHGFCDARMTQARAALLRKQVAKAPPKPDKTKEKTKENAKRKAKPKADPDE
jgi:hypothetical protein